MTSVVGNLHKILCCKFTKLRFLPARRYASAGTIAIYGPVSVCMSVTSRCSIEKVERIGLVFGTHASFDLLHSVL